MSLRVILIPLAVLTALALLLLAFQMTTSAPPAPTEQAPPPPLQVSILVAARQLSPGMLVRDEDFIAKSMPQRDLAAGSLTDTSEVRAEIRGALVRRFLEPGAMLSRADLLRARDRGFLAAVLEPGTRAVSIAVDAVSGVSGLIWPGDRVDVILTQQLDGQNVPIAKRIFGETVLTNVRVIAVDQQITEGGVAAPGADGVGKVARTITLQVAADQAERVAVAGRLGHIVLAVRAIETETTAAAAAPAAPDGTAAAATPAPNTIQPVFGADVSPELSASGRHAGQHLQLIQGGQREDLTFQ